MNKGIKKGRNLNLNKAREAKNDEFYTKYEDIEKTILDPEISSQLNNKVIYCNCDDPSFSNFYKFFKINFTKLGLKRLISTYKSDNPYRYDYDGINEIKTPIESGLFEYNSDIINEFKDNIIIVTNPPFSLMRLYINFIMNLNVKFLIIAPLTILTSQSIFPYFKQRKFKILNNLVNTFENTDIKINTIYWITNLNFTFKEKLTLTKSYNKSEYTECFNYPALFIDKCKDIPYDYKGYMAVPISCFEKLDSDRFELYSTKEFLNKEHIYIYNNKKTNFNIDFLIKSETPTNIIELTTNTYLICKFKRILVKHK